MNARKSKGSKKKKGGCLRVIGITFAVFVGIGIVGNLLDGDTNVTAVRSTTNPQPPTPTPTSDVTPQEEPVEEPELVWVEVARFQVTGAGGSDPFTVDGPVRAFYSFDFEQGDGYILGYLTLREFIDGECRMAPVSEWYRMGDGDDKHQEVDFGERTGTFCGNIHLTDPNWNKGVVEAVFEALIPAP